MNAKQLKRQAETLIKSNAMPEVMQTLRISLFNQWAATEPGQSHLREQLYFQMRAVDLVAGSIEALASAPDDAD